MMFFGYIIRPIIPKNEYTIRLQNLLLKILKVGAIFDRMEQVIYHPKDLKNLLLLK